MLGQYRRQQQVPVLSSDPCIYEARTVGSVSDTLNTPCLFERLVSPCSVLRAARAPRRICARQGDPCQSAAS